MQHQTQTLKTRLTESAKPNHFAAETAHATAGPLDPPSSSAVQTVAESPSSSSSPGGYLDADAAAASDDYGVPRSLSLAGSRAGVEPDLAVSHSADFAGKYYYQSADFAGKWVEEEPVVARQGKLSAALAEEEEASVGDNLLFFRFWGVYIPIAAGISYMLCSVANFS